MQVLRHVLQVPTEAADARWYVSPDGSLNTFDGAVMGNDTGESCCASHSVTTGTSGSPVSAPALSGHATRSSTLFMNSAPVPTIAKSFWHALMIVLRVSSPLSFESMKSTTTLRPARPP